MVDLETSDEMLDVGQLMMDVIGTKNSDEYITLHLRRGDYRECSTDVDDVISYLRCSMHDDLDVKKVVVLTNGEKEYTWKLKQKFKMAFPNQDIIFLGEILESNNFVKQITETHVVSIHQGERFVQDNCFRYRAEKVAMEVARFHLERGHGHCSKCDYKGVFIKTMS